MPRPIEPTLPEAHRLRQHRQWMNSFPLRLPHPNEVFSHIPDKIDPRGYDRTALKLSRPENAFGHIPRLLPPPDEAFADVGVCDVADLVPTYRKRLAHGPR